MGTAGVDGDEASQGNPRRVAKYQVGQGTQDGIGIKDGRGEAGTGRMYDVCRVCVGAGGRPGSVCVCVRVCLRVREREGGQGKE